MIESEPKKSPDLPDEPKGGTAAREDEAERSSNASGLSMAMRLGTELVVATMMGAGFGYWLDTQFSTQPWLLILFLVFGTVAGFKNVYRIVQPASGYESNSTKNAGKIDRKGL